MSGECDDCGEHLVDFRCHEDEEITSDRIKSFQKSGLMGCFDGTGVTSENYKEHLYGEGWISVKDRLPEESIENYFLFTDGEITFFGRYFDGNSYQSECLWKPENGWIHSSSVITHWMPLPEGPK